MGQHNEFFAKADANKDGMLSLPEYMEYAKLWLAHFKSLGADMPANHEFEKQAFEAYKVSGKDGITNDDFQQVMKWEEEAMAQQG